MADSVRVRVPATSANLGPAYDCMGLALDLWDEVGVEVLDHPGVQIDVTGEGADTVPHDESHLVVATLRQGLVELGYPRPDAGLHLTAFNAIPQSRGLGSSAAAIVSGLALAWGLACPGAPLDRTELLTMAAAIEGHPDNAAPAILGGAQLAWLSGGVVNHIGLAVNPSIIFRVFVPDRHVPTALARQVLPEQVDRADAVQQVLAASLLVTALTTSPEHLLAATQDWLHQPYRRTLMPESAALMDALRDRGVATVISGAGPTVLALGARDQFEGAWDVDTTGFVVHDLVLGEGVHLL
ncbi:homoserine kinase [Cutibacterium avidum]|uniref:homoserine kinase n=1 Tax=Cutibacterium avidum TaxID=33010 RepID=UPI0007643078|nr:homoserine kinase [Cutibacterium avidum]KXA66317.1 homoserine kinase [Cutibacterium avidum]MCO6630629.1 homoserine kinase [Cutibacterium avidum]MCO6659670.1 homoserine kinase [Cutibacterium avidum]MCO6664103.1 homoserine kinase [Cutibacterium avidum]MCT1415656.1 homoserine kinase [Cutibacterium avidum]